jgi:hypothetical protein
MVSEHRSAKLLILGGALEYQKVSNKLASIGTILEQVRVYLLWIFIYFILLATLLMNDLAAGKGVS